MTLTQFADRLGVTRQLVSRAIKAGRVPCVVVGPNGRPEIPDEKFELAKSQIEKSARPCAHAKIGAIVKAKAQNAPVAKVPKGPTAKLAKEGATELMDLESIAMIEDPYKRSVTLNQYWASRIKKQESLVRDGELVEAVKAEALLVDLGKLLRDSLLSIGPRLAPVLALETDAKEIRRRIDAEHRTALSGVADAIARLRGGIDAPEEEEEFFLIPSGQDTQLLETLIPRHG